jgi:hypothetical protein
MTAAMAMTTAREKAGGIVAAESLAKVEGSERDVGEGEIPESG